MIKSFEKRKKDHISLSLDQRTQNLTDSQFSRIKLNHVAMPEINFSDVQLNTKILNQDFSSPLFISSMTAGHEQGEKINYLLAELAEEKKIMFALGSQKKILIDPKNINEYKKLTQKFSKVRFLSNIGLEEVILNPVSDILKIVEKTNSIGLIVHLNALQEIFQKQNEAVFRNGYKKLKNLVENCDVPVIVKEVGFGINAQTSKKLFDCGVSVVDLSGSGGTHWGMIEALRNQNSAPKLLDSVVHFKDWGMTTIECLLQNQKDIFKNTYWASGGVRSGVDAIKCLALGAKAVGIAQPFLKMVLNDKNKIQSIDEIVEKYSYFEFEMKTAMFCMGIKNMNELRKSKAWHAII